MSERTAFFLPTRKGSERVRDKNTRPFAGMAGGLMENKLSQLTATRLIDEILVSTNDERCMEVARRFADSRIRIIPRPDRLCTSQTDLQDLIAYVPTITEAEHIVWGHVTTPLCSAADYDNAVEAYFDAIGRGSDSLIGVKAFRNFLLDGRGRIINNQTEKAWPRTQDLEPLYEVNHAVFIAPREVYERQRNRVGQRPYLHEMSELVSYDIDWEEDFEIAETLYQNRGPKV